MDSSIYPSSEHDPTLVEIQSSQKILNPFYPANNDLKNHVTYCKPLKRLGVIFPRHPRLKPWAMFWFSIAHGFNRGS